MDYTYYLLLSFILISIVHLGFLIKNLMKSFVNKNFPNPNNLEDLKYTPKKNILRIILSITFFFSPLFFFLGIKNSYSQNESLDIFLLTVLILITGFLIYFSEYKIWSKHFKDDLDSKSPISKLHEEFLLNKSSLENDILLTKNNLAEIDKNTTKIKHDFEELNTLKNKKGNKIFDFVSFFKSKSQYHNFITLLVDNDFYNEKHKHTPTYLCILTAKLSDLKVINIHQKNKYFCNAIADHFKIEDFNPSNLSTTIKDHKQNSFSHAHKTIFDSFSYLDDIKAI